MLLNKLSIKPRSIMQLTVTGFLMARLVLIQMPGQHELSNTWR